MNNTFQVHSEQNGSSHFKRSRLSQLLAQAATRPLIIVCAGAGYGKTLTVSDFLLKYEIPAAWLQISSRDNVGSRFWENFVKAFAKVNKSLAEDFREFGFPDTEDRINQCVNLWDRGMPNQKNIVVLDDIHFLKDPAVIHFVERAIHRMPPNRLVILICREPPLINITGLQAKGLVANISEEDLNFTENELAQYLKQQGLSVTTQNLREIFQDTYGWAFAVNFIARSLKKSPNYSGYVRSAMKNNIFQLMEIEVFNMISKRLQHFLVCLSLLDHFSADLVSLLAGNDERMLAELRQQSAFIRFDSYINAYLIHHLFLNYLRAKQVILNEEEKRHTYLIAADWCNKNGFKIDALTYYEKIGDYESIVSIFLELPLQVPQDIAQYAVGIFDRAPSEAFNRVTFLSMIHIRIVMCLGLWKETFELLAYYETKYLQLPEDNTFRNHSLGSIYYCWGIARALMCTIDDHYDFHEYHIKQSECMKRVPINLGRLANHFVGPWISLVGSSRQGAPQEFIDALTVAVKHTSLCLNGCMAGKDDLARGELKFYQGDTRAAETFIIKGIAYARKYRQFELVHRGLLYMMRIGVSHGDYAMVKQALSDIEALLDEEEYAARFLSYDIAIGWYYNYILEPERVPDWLKKNFSPYGHVYFIENFANQMKIYYCYIMKNYAPLLAYMEDQKRRESILYGRAELRAMEACVLFKIKDRMSAISTLREAYEIAAPNSLIMPFIWLGKDMRTLVSAALREQDCGIPKLWLEMIGRKSASYAKYHSQLLFGYNKANGVNSLVALSYRENEVLRDMYHGLSRSEIAASQNLSINTVKLVINSIYEKLNAYNIVDVIRIAAEKKLV